MHFSTYEVVLILFLFPFSSRSHVKISFQLGSDAMRLILVKPTNATRRLDLTGEVFHDGDREHCPLGGPATLTKSPERKCKQNPSSSAEGPVPPQETSLCCESSPPHQRSNGISPPRVSAQMSPLQARNLTLSQLSDQDWLLLCGRVSSIEDDSPSPESAASCVGHPNHNDRCGCSCLDARQRAEVSSFRRKPKQGTLQDCLSRDPNRRGLSSSPHIQPFPQSTEATNPRQELSQQTHQQGLLNPATNHPAYNFQLREKEGRKGLLPPCNRFKLQESAAQATLFNIPLNSGECAEAKQELQHHSQSAAGADFNWREVFGKEPLLVQQRPKPHCSVSSSDPKSSGDPSIVLNCRHLPYDLSVTAQKKSSPMASDKSEQSLYTSQCSSLGNQDLVEEEDRQQQHKVNT